MVHELDQRGGGSGGLSVFEIGGVVALTSLLPLFCRAQLARQKGALGAAQRWSIRVQLLDS